ncbi:phospholipase effector Tle1 domain-containing protein [Undibacterium sp. Ji42W]|uniref:phospholipase effector Tle1 domain-containing protein n=1 Tax=Undibacterium sp. Ji42W TaxID=3413039 RepID=UPI003BF09E55
MAVTAGNNGVDVKVATPEDLATYTRAQAQVDAFKVPAIYDSSDPHARVFIANFDGTGNDAINDPDHLTNIGILKKQLEDISRKNPHIYGYYLEGPGTQGGVMGTVDGALGVTHSLRVETMYEKFEKKVNSWLREDPDAKISVINTGFSRGAESAAVFSRLVAERGVQDLQSKVIQMPPDGSGPAIVSYTAPPLRAGDSIPQTSVFFDPVGTGVQWLDDRRPAVTVLSAIQIKAKDEQRLQFPGTNLLPDGTSADGRFLSVTVAGAHSDIGGSYEKNGLSNRTFNMMSQFVNASLGGNLVKKLDIPTDPDMSVIHDSSQHKVYWIKVPGDRLTIDRQDLLGRSIEPLNPSMEVYRQNAKALGASLDEAKPAVAGTSVAGLSIPATSGAEVKTLAKDDQKPLQAIEQAATARDAKPAANIDLLAVPDSPSSRLISQFRESPRATTQAKP